MFFFFFSSRRRHTRCGRDWSSDVCSSDLSLLRRAAGGRFFMLATIREFARSRLESTEQARTVRAAHAAHYLEFAALHRDEIDAETKEWLDRFELEHDNFRAALSWYEATADAEHELALAEA